MGSVIGLPYAPRDLNLKSKECKAGRSVASPRYQCGGAPGQHTRVSRAPSSRRIVHLDRSSAAVTNSPYRIPLSCN